MKKSITKPLIALVLLLALVFVCMFTADGIQRDHGRVEIEDGVIELDEGKLAYKLYRPLRATQEQKAPGVLLLHGYQNDRETNAAYAIELARRGAVVLSLDEYGHGASSIGMAQRGYVNHRVKVNYGNDSEADGTFVEVGGPSRFRIMMNFSNMSFFDPHYSTDADGNSITDSSMGGVSAYAMLASLPYVDDTRLAVSGHSMGTWSSWSVGAAYSGATNDAGEDISPKAIVLQCGELFRDSVYDSSIHFNNVMLLQAKYDEFSYFRDYSNTVNDELLKTPLRTEFLGCTADKAAWDTTFGSFDDGSARRIELIITNHRLTTHDAHGMSAALDWFANAVGIDAAPAVNDQVFMQKELLVLLSMLLSIAAMLALMELLLKTPFFAGAAHGLPDRPEKADSGSRWWRGAIITILIAGLSYPFMTQLGHGLLPLPEKIFRMTVGNGFLSWYLLLILVMLLTTVLSVRKAKKRGVPMDYADLGLAAADGKTERLDWALCGKCALLALCMVAFLYLLTALFSAVIDLDFRFIWPFFKAFTGERLVQFLVYIPVFALFFLLNNSKIFAQMRVPEASRPGFAGFISCWWKYALCMVGGVLLIILIEYIPFFAGIGPGADLLFSPTFGGPFMSLMILFVPQVLVFSVLCTYIYRRTDSVYTGAFTVACMACWIVTGGSAMM